MNTLISYQLLDHVYGAWILDVFSKYGIDRYTYIKNTVHTVYNYMTCV